MLLGLPAGIFRLIFSFDLAASIMVSYAFVFIVCCSALCVIHATMTPTDEAAETIAAECVLGRYETAGGLVRFSQQVGGGPTSITGMITNVSPGLHGWHVHELGITNEENACLRAGGHFNPLKQTHGAPDADVRHFGDLGNFEADRYGVGLVNWRDRLVSLVGPEDRSVLGRTLVIHAGEDDLGLGGNAESLKTGNAGSRVGCCVITLVSTEL